MISLDPMEAPLGRHVRELSIKRSRFIGVVMPFDHSNPLKDLLRDLQEEYPRATHYCWAYRTYFPRRDEGSSDGGEPSGTAGRPILNAIYSSGLQQVAVVVIRYYGGIKLGVRGLIDAYHGSALDALGSCPRGRLEMCVPVQFVLDYSKEDQLRHWWGRMGLRGDAMQWAYGERLEARGYMPEHLRDHLLLFLSSAAPHGEVECTMGEAELRQSPLDSSDG